MSNWETTAFDHLLQFINSSLANLKDFYHSLPGSSFIIKYIQNSYQNDPFRTFLELCLIIFVLWYVLEKNYRIDRNEVHLTAEEVEELVEEWQPEPLVPPLNDTDQHLLKKVPVLEGGQSLRPLLDNGQSVLNFASFNFLSLVNDERIKEEAVQTLRTYGVGSCGPPGFYGTLDVHMKLEEEIAQFLKTESAIVYSQGFMTSVSVLPCFSKRGDILVVDEGINFALQKAVDLTRSRIYYFKHNDMKDLKRVLESIEQENLKKKKKLTRRFIVVEGLYINSGDIVPLPEIIELKEKFKYRLLIDETYSFGILGHQGRGVSSYYDIPSHKIDVIIGSLCNAIGASGGFCVGNKEIVDHQRLSGVGYLFSASMPAILTNAGRLALKMIQETPDLLQNLVENTKTLRKLLKQYDSFQVSGDDHSPIMHIHIKADRIRSLKKMPLDILYQDIVDECLEKGVMITRAKYIQAQERVPQIPSIRICCSSGFTMKELELLSETLATAVDAVLKKHQQ